MQGVIYDKICIYKNVPDGEFCEFTDIFKGKIEDVPIDVLDKEVATIGASPRRYVDIMIKE